MVFNFKTEFNTLYPPRFTPIFVSPLFSSIDLYLLLFSSMISSFSSFPYESNCQTQLLTLVVSIIIIREVPS